MLDSVHSDQSNTTLTNLAVTTLLIWWENPTINADEETIRWCYGNTKYKIYTQVLEDLNLKFLMLQHSLNVKT